MNLDQDKGGTEEYLIRSMDFLFSEYKNASLTKYLLSFIMNQILVF